MINIKYLWKYLRGDYQGLKDNLENKMQDYERRILDEPENAAYYQALINSFQSQMSELDRKIDEKAKRN